MKTSITQTPTIIALKTQKGKKSLNFNEILYLEASNKHTLIYLLDGRCFDSNHMLKQLEEELPTSLFCRCHNSYIVNNVYVECINGSLVYLTNQAVIPLSRKWKQLFIDNYEVFKQSQISISVNYELIGVK
jgi:two-component system LytT family response regulator